MHYIAEAEGKPAPASKSTEYNIVLSNNFDWTEL